jgi:hypothetical protein
VNAWWAREDSNLQPDRYEPAALTIGLRARSRGARRQRRGILPSSMPTRSGNRAGRPMAFKGATYMRTYVLLVPTPTFPGIDERARRSRCWRAACQLSTLEPSGIGKRKGLASIEKRKGARASVIGAAGTGSGVKPDGDIGPLMAGDCEGAGNGAGIRLSTVLGSGLGKFTRGGKALCARGGDRWHPGWQPRRAL